MSEVAVAERTRRRYDSSLRREKAAETRRAIVMAGAELLRGSHVRDWEALTIRAVAEGAGVNERTVYRHFLNERGLRDAVMHQIEQEAGIDLDGMHLEDVADVARRIFEHVSSFPLTPPPALDPTLADANRRQHSALLGAIAGHAGDWSAAQRGMAAGLLDVLWSVGAYERLVRDWQLTPDDAVQALVWAIGLVDSAVRQGNPPAAGRSRRRR